MYTEDAKLMPEGSEAISGRSAIRQWFETKSASRPACNDQVQQV
jgi:ketosteroid isomerase-like protein